MKKSVIILLVLLATSLLPIQAYECITIFFTHGNKSETFYTTDIDSIRYSKLDVDSIKFENWQVQEIWTTDSVYRYPLASIENISFTDVDINVVAKDIERVNKVIVPLYITCKSTVDISKHLDKICNTEGVEKAWTDNQTLFVKIRNYGTITFSYSPSLTSGNTNQNNAFVKRNYIIPLQRSEENSKDSHILINKVCLYDQTNNNESDGFNDAKETIKEVCNMYNEMGISPHFTIDLTPEFFRKEIYYYDYIFLITHGEYDEDAKLHWIYTSEEIHKVKFDDENLGDFITVCEKFFSKYPLNSARQISIGTQIEKRNGTQYVVYYAKISEEYISSTKQSFNNPDAIVFNVACKSLMKNHKIANAFIKKGAGCYVGYTEENNIGHRAGQEFFRNLLNGCSVSSAYEHISPSCKSQDWFYVYNTKSQETYYKSDDEIHEDGEIWDDEKEWEAKIDWEVNNTKNNFIKPETFDADYTMYNSEFATRLKGRIKMTDPDAAKFVKFQFAVSENPDMNSAQFFIVEGKYDKESHYMQFDKIFSNAELPLGIPYYYCASINDGVKDCFGEIKQLGDIPYVTLNENTATFYYNKQLKEHEGEVFPVSYYWRWRELVDYITFDKSFENYRPVKVNYFSNCEKLKEIYNIEYLKTDCVTDMSSMFSGCSSLTNIDVSSFNISNVTNMRSMFMGCSSLTNIDMNSFNTSNVTDMRSMFSGCKSLTNLNLDSFNTSNVTDMSSMFDGCSSLTSIDISNFNTSNVTSMRSMFCDCSSLTSLNLRNFNTSCVQSGETKYMFRGCTSLITIYAGDWNRNEEDSDMFFPCLKLRGEKGSSPRGNGMWDGRYACIDKGYGIKMGYFTR